MRTWCVAAALTVLSAPFSFAESADVETVLDALRGHDIVILGEVHDNERHHALQAEITARLGPQALVFEMFGPEAAARAMDLAERSTEALRTALDWDDSGWPDFALYAPIIAAAPDAVLYGAGLPRDDVRAAVREGAAALFPGDAARFGLTEPLPSDEQAARETGQQEAHCNAMPPDLLPGMVEAQRLRDAAFARTALEALAEAGPPVVVIAGWGHARRDWGIPAAVGRAAPEVMVAALGLLEDHGSEAPRQPFDAVIVTAPQPREDPCAAFLDAREEAADPDG